MLAKNLWITFRTLARTPAYSLIVLAGLGVGFAASLLVYAYVDYETTHESSHEKAHRIYRLIRKQVTEGGTGNAHRFTPGLLASTLRTDFSQVEKAGRVYYRSDGGWMRSSDKVFQESFAVADPSILDIFTLPLVEGDKRTITTEPNGILITRRIREKHFSGESVVGKTITIDDVKIGGTFRISGVLEDVPRNSHLQFDFLTFTPPSTIYMNDLWNTRAVADENVGPVVTYVLLKEDADPRGVENGLTTIVSSTRTQSTSRITYYLQPLRRLHLYSASDYGLRPIGKRPFGNIQTVYIFSSAALLILVIAGINYINLATARSLKRSREIGVRKVTGANRGSLILQFLIESIVVTGVALCVGISLAQIAMPSFNAIAEIDLPDLMHHPARVLTFIPIALIVGILSGLYPALFISRFEPVRAIKGTVHQTGGRIGLRKALVISQFAISTFLIIGAVTVREQLNYIRTKDMGFDRSVVLNMHVFRLDYDLIPRYQAVKQAFLEHPGVAAACASLTRIGKYTGWSNVEPEGGESILMGRMSIDEDYADLYGLDIIRGRNISDRPHGGGAVGFGTGTVSAPAAETDVEFLINESAAKQLGWTDPIGKQLHVPFNNGATGTIVGVVRDFHTYTLRSKIEPTVLYTWQPSFRWLSLKIRPDRIEETIAGLETTWKRFLPDRPFEYFFLDEMLDFQYRKDIQLGRVFNAFFVLAIFVACLGLLGLVAFVTEQRTREIGVRKVLGASLKDIFTLMTGDFARWILVGSVISCPLAYLAARSWLDEFAYTIDLGPSLFLAGCGMALIVGIAAISLQILRAARSDPMVVLRSE